MPMIIYEVNLTVDADVADEYATWLKDHIGEMLQFDGFIRARWLENESAESARQWVIHYYLRDRASLDEYFIHHAEEMRRNGMQRFPGQFSATRRILEGRMEM